MGVGGRQSPACLGLNPAETHRLTVKCSRVDSPPQASVTISKTSEGVTALQTCYENEK